MARTLISYTLAAGIMTPPVLLSPQTSPQLEVEPTAPQYPLLRTTQPIQLDTHPISHNLPTVPPPPVIPTSQTITPQFVAHRPDPTRTNSLEIPVPPELPPKPAVVMSEPPRPASVAVLPPLPPPIAETVEPSIPVIVNTPPPLSRAEPVFSTNIPEIRPEIRPEIKPEAVLPTSLMIETAEPPAPVILDEPITMTSTEPVFSTQSPDAIPIAVLPPPPSTIATSDRARPDIDDQLTDLTMLRDVVSQAHITSTAPISAYDIMSGEPLWEKTEALIVQANNHQVILDEQSHTELILTVPKDEFITMNGTDYPGGLIIRAQDNELYVINYLSSDQMITIQPDIISAAEQPVIQPHHWYDLDSRLPEQSPQIARRGSP